MGDVAVVDVDPDVSSLFDALDQQSTIAETRSEQLILWLVVPDCVPCDGFWDALRDERMQEALRGTRIVRLNVLQFDSELRQLRIPSRRIPGFALLDERHFPKDYIHGGEWDDDIAENIAPILGDFVRGKLEKRRNPWRGAARDEETPI
jgi:hypothetical protein